MPQAPATFRPSNQSQRTEQQRKRDYDSTREQSHKRGYGHKWRQARGAWLREHPLCIECEAGGVITPAFAIDHIKPHKGDMKLFWDRKNWQSLCKHHHDSKTAREDSSFAGG
jgi:5-methylcytosine-specific restriction enzyme A